MRFLTSERNKPNYSLFTGSNKMIELNQTESKVGPELN